MKTTANIKSMIYGSILLIAALSLPVTKGSAQVGNQNHESFVMSTIMPLNLLDYAASLRISAVNMADVYEAEPALESWMVNSDDWKSMNTNYGTLLVEEAEEPMQIESWMLEDFSVKTADNAIDETVAEESLGIENWMLHPETWGK